MAVYKVTYLLKLRDKTIIKETLFVWPWSDSLTKRGLEYSFPWCLLKVHAVPTSTAMFFYLIIQCNQCLKGSFCFIIVAHRQNRSICLNLPIEHKNHYCLIPMLDLNIKMTTVVAIWLSRDFRTRDHHHITPSKKKEDSVSWTTGKTTFQLF